MTMSSKLAAWGGRFIPTAKPVRRHARQVRLHVGLALILAPVLVLVGLIQAAPLPAGAAASRLEGGSVVAGLGPNVTASVSLVDFQCVDTQSFPGFNTSTWREVHGFQIEPFTTAHGCGVRASWAQWKVSFGAPFDVSGTIWFGQDDPGLPYYAKCDFAELTCIPDPNSRSQLLVTLPQCPFFTSHVWAIRSGNLCSIQWTNAPQYYIALAEPTLVSNVGWKACKLDHKEVQPGGSITVGPSDVFHPPEGYFIPDGPCLIALKA